MLLPKRKKECKCRKKLLAQPLNEFLLLIDFVDRFEETIAYDDYDPPDR